MKMTNVLEMIRWLYSGVSSVSSCGYSKLTLGGDGQYCIIVSIATFSHCIEGIDGEVIGGGSMQAGDSKACCSGGKHIHIQETGWLIPSVSVEQQPESRTVLWLWQDGIRPFYVSPYTKSLLQTPVEAGDPLQSDRIMSDTDLAKWWRRIRVTWEWKKRGNVEKANVLSV